MAGLWEIGTNGQPSAAASPASPAQAASSRYQLIPPNYFTLDALLARLAPKVAAGDWFGVAQLGSGAASDSRFLPSVRLFGAAIEGKAMFAVTNNRPDYAAAWIPMLIGLTHRNM